MRFAVQAGHRFLNAQARLRRAIGLGAIERNPQIVAQIFFEIDDPRVEPGPRIGVLREETACESGLNGIEIGGGRPRVIDRHERFVEGLRNELTFAAQIEDRENAEGAGHHAHDQEGQEDSPPDRA